MINGRSVKIQLWDTAGQERFLSITRSYFRGASGVVLVFDVTSSGSFHDLQTRYNSFVEEGAISRDTPCLLIANKTDIGTRAVSSEELAGWCEQKGNIPFYELSAMNKTSVDSALEGFAQRIIGSQLQHENDNP